MILETYQNGKKNGKNNNNNKTKRQLSKILLATNVLESRKDMFLKIVIVKMKLKTKLLNHGSVTLLLSSLGRRFMHIQTIQDIYSAYKCSYMLA